MREYLADARQIAARKFQLYGQLMNLIDDFEASYFGHQHQ
jgi:hypothetical protein